MGNWGSGMLRMDGGTWWFDSWEEQKVLGPRDRLYYRIVTKSWAPKPFIPGLQITADGGCSHEIKRHLFLGRKAIPNLDFALKSKDITLSTKVHIVKVMTFPLVMYRCETWTIKRAE